MKIMDANTALSEALGVAPPHSPPATVTKPLSDRPVASNSQIDNDTEYARTNIYDVIEQGTKAIELASQIANESLHPRALEVLGQLLKVQSDNVDKLLALHKARAALNQPAVGAVAPNVNITGNVVFTGTTADLLEMIRQERQPFIEGEIEEDD